MKVLNIGIGKQLMSQIRTDFKEIIEDLSQREKRSQLSQQNMLIIVILDNGAVVLSTFFAFYSMRLGIKAQNDKEQAVFKEQYARSLIEASVSGGGNPRKDGCKNPLFYNWGSAPDPLLALRQGC